MEEIKLRDYQIRLVEKSREALKKNKHIIVQAATGSGKTLCFSYLAKLSTQKGRKVVILSNRVELLIQSEGSLRRLGVEAEYISPSHKKVPTGNCIVAMAQTLRARFGKPEWKEFLQSVDILIVDEIHMQDANYLLESNIFKDKFVLGFTATPRRGGKQRQLGLDFAEIVDAVTTQDLIDGGYLVPAVHYTLDAPDLSKLTEINPMTGDYNETSMAALFDNPKMYAGVIENYKALTPDTKAIVFCCNQTHAIQTCLEFENAGISARFLVSGLKKTDKGYDLFKNNQHLTGKRKTIVEDFGKGRFQVLCNASILTTGFDCPSIETVIVNRATQSLALVLQMYGRGGRPYPGKDHFNILDFGDNVKRHGAYELERKWSVWHDTKEGGGVAMTKECDPIQEDCKGKTGCGRLIHIGYSECPFCGYIFKTPEELRIVELSKIVDGFELKDMTPQQLVAYAELKHYNKRWVFRKIYEGSEDRRQFVAAMKQLGYDYKFIYRTYDEYKRRK